MAETTRMSLNVPEDVPVKLAELAGGVKKMGNYLTILIRQAHASQAEVSNSGDLELLTGAVKHLSAKVKEIDARLQQVEEKQQDRI